MNKFINEDKVKWIRNNLLIERINKQQNAKRTQLRAKLIQLKMV